MGATVGFVLGGGGVLGAVEVGMVRALTDAGVVPDLIVGTSIGALNGVVIASDPHNRVAERLIELWSSDAARAAFRASGPRLVGQFFRTGGAHAYSSGPLRRLLSSLKDVEFDDLAVPFQCCAASIERAAEQWFDSGPVVEAVLASCAVPGLLPPVRIGDEHYLDGGLVNSIPISRAVELGAEQIFVMQVGRIEKPLQVPSRPWEVASVAFEIARRHRFARDMAAIPDGVRVHVLPTGFGSDDPDPSDVGRRRSKLDDFSPMNYLRFELIARRIDRAYRASRAYLAAEGIDPEGTDTSTAGR
jgi:NTE family protein